MRLSLGDRVGDLVYLNRGITRNLFSEGVFSILLIPHKSQRPALMSLCREEKYVMGCLSPVTASSYTLLSSRVLTFSQLNWETDRKLEAVGYNRSELVINV